MNVELELFINLLFLWQSERIARSLDSVVSCRSKNARGIYRVHSSSPHDQNLPEGSLLW